MKTIKLIACAAAAVVMAASCGNSGPKISTDAKLPSSSEVDSVSYLVGVNFGYFIKANNFGTDLNYGKIKKGMEDFLKAQGDPNDPAFNDQLEISPALMNRLFNDFIAKRTAYEAEYNLKLGEQFLKDNKQKDGVNSTDSGLQYTIIADGSEEKIGPKDTVYMHYTGTLIDGTEFDKTDRASEPVRMLVDRVIPGFSEGLQLIGEGGHIKLFIPGNLAYGPRNMGTIKPNSTLLFDIEVHKVGKAPVEEEELTK